MAGWVRPHDGITIELFICLYVEVLGRDVVGAVESGIMVVANTTTDVNLTYTRTFTGRNTAAVLISVGGPRTRTHGLVGRKCRVVTCNYSISGARTIGRVIS